MADMIETTTEGGKVTTKWWSNFLTPQTMFWILAGFVSLVLFWKDSHDNWDKTKDLEKVVATKADQEDLKALKDQVNRLYQTNKEDREKESREIEEVADWMHYQQGYQEGKKK